MLLGLNTKDITTPQEIVRIDTPTKGRKDKKTPTGSPSSGETMTQPSEGSLM